MESDFSKQVLQMIFSVLGGLGIFLLGMKYMSEGMQAIAGNRLRKMIGAVTNNRIVASGIGTFVTCMVQSSSVTTVIVVGFVSAGIMELTQAIGVIMGANIGTTITGWILVLKIGKYGLPILGLAAFFFLFSKNDKVRYTGMAIMGIGMVFFGLELMSSGFKPMRVMPEFREWFTKFSPDTYWGLIKCVLAGCVLTAIVQSSSATLAITMSLATTGVIEFQAAAALVLGENIGTTITAFIASIGTTTNAKRAAYSHIIFNVIGVIWITTIFHWYLKVVVYFLGVDPGVAVMVDGAETFPHAREGIAFVHSGFNITNTLLFLPFVPLIAKIVTRIVPDKKAKEISHLTYLDSSVIRSPAIALQQSHTEIVKMGQHVEKMFSYLDEIVSSNKNNKKKLIQRHFHREEILDVIQKEITEFVGHVLSGQISRESAQNARMQLRMADEYESISDYLSIILKLYLKGKNSGIRLANGESSDLLKLNKMARNYVEIINEGLKENRVEVLSKAKTIGDSYNYTIKEMRERLLNRMEQNQVSPLECLIVSDLLSSFRRVKDHGLNIAEAVAGEK